MKEYDKVNVKIKVVDIKDPQNVGKNKTKREIIIADSHYGVLILRN